MLERVIESLLTREREEPWAMGCTSLALARALRVPEAELVPELARMVAENAVIRRSGYYATPGFEPRLTAEQRSFFDERLRVDPAAPFHPVAAFAEATRSLRAAQVEGLARAFDMLIATGEIAHVGESLYRQAQIQAVERAARAFLAEHGSMTAAQFRDLLNSSRKYVVPMLERLDACGVTRREGDLRVACESEPGD
jgi:selenocysteine-specific elongation factor